MEHDDEPIGETHTRRRAIELIGTPAVLWFAGCSSDGSSGGAEPTHTATPTDTATDTPTATATPTVTPTPEGSSACVVRPRLGEGPWYEDDDDNPERSDIRTDTESETVHEGVPLELTFRVFRMDESGCSPIEGAIVDVWQADARGWYSDVEEDATPTQGSTVGQDFLRGHQRTAADGSAEFSTIYPGWYPGRAPHVHFKIRSPESVDNRYLFTSQLFFSDDRTDEIYAREPYSSRTERDTTLDEDTAYQRAGDELVLTLAEADEGYTTTFNIAMHI